MSRKAANKIKEQISDVTRQVIKELRDRDKLTQTELAQRIGINRSLISQYEAGEREPSLMSLVKLANYAHVSVDYLLGRGNTPKYELTKSEEKIVATYRSMHTGYELTVKKDPGTEENLTDEQIKIKQEIKL